MNKRHVESAFKRQSVSCQIGLGMLSVSLNERRIENKWGYMGRPSYANPKAEQSNLPTMRHVVPFHRGRVNKGSRPECQYIRQVVLMMQSARRGAVKSGSVVFDMLDQDRALIGDIPVTSEELRFLR